MCADDGPSFELVELPNGWTVGRFPALDALGAVHAVTTRRGLDVNLVRDDHQAAGRELVEALGLRGAAYCGQVHGELVLIVDRDGPAGEADGLVTRTPGLGVWGRGADCPLILAACPTGVVAVAHASWRGTVRMIAPRMVAQMAALGAKPQKIVACVSPSAGPCCYEVGPEVLKAAVEGIGPHAATFFRATGPALPAGQGRRDRKALFDLWSANRDQLLRAGLRERNIHVAGLCTMCRNDLFPSHRREGDAAGRFAAIVARR
jgi:hypothetical protein